MKHLFIFILSSVVFSTSCLAQFTGESGVYYLGTASVPTGTVIYANPNISGVVVRFNWGDIEPAPGTFDWSYIDAEIAKAVSYNKKISLQPLSMPDWVKGLGAQLYYYIDQNTFHTTYGHVVSGFIPWDTIYVNRYKVLLQSLSTKYASDTTVSYINTIGSSFSRGLPDTVLTDTTLLTKQPFWTTYSYNADTLGNLINRMTDYYMGLFPTTPLWTSVDYVKFQVHATSQPQNYLATIYCNYGITNYSTRFGLWREDISGCNPPATINSGNQWYILQQNPCRTGAQMLWNVQDGPTRMNPCGIVPNTKSVVLDSSVGRGLSLGMRYLEIYGIDITDTSLATSIQQANTNLHAKGFQCNSVLIQTNEKENVLEHTFSIYPNPTTSVLNISYPENQAIQVQIFNSMGMLLKEVSFTRKIQVDISDIPCGLYFVRQKNVSRQTVKFIKE
jgi:hypothetical protein